MKKLSLTEAQIVAILREADKRERRIPQLRRVRGSGLYECAGCGYQASVTAWLLRRKITNAMRRGEHELLLGGVVELDKSLVSGRAPARDRRRERQNPDQGRRRPDPARQHRQERGRTAAISPLRCPTSTRMARVAGSTSGDVTVRLRPPR